MLSRKCALGHKPIVTGFYQLLLGTSDTTEKRSGSITSSAAAAAPGVKCVFVAMQRQLNTTFCFKLGKTVIETQGMFETGHRKTRPRMV
jgi:hypothetical protein